jgi:hypothetical protein
MTIGPRTIGPRATGPKTVEPKTTGPTTVGPKTSGPITFEPSPTQRGSASLIGLALCAFVVIATLVTADIGALAFARARAETAADLAALAAVTPYPGSLGPDAAADPGGLGSPTGRAALVATSNGADMVACSCDSLDTTVSVRVRTRLIPFATTVGVRAYARAVLPLAVDPAAVAEHEGSRISTSANGQADEVGP